MPKPVPVARSVVIALLLCLPPAALAQPRSLRDGLPGGTFVLHNGSKCLDVNEPQVGTDGGRVQLWDCLERPSQLWRFEQGRVVNVAANRCLDVHGPDAGSNGARIQVSNCHGGPNQLWNIDRGQLVVRVDGRCLDVHGPDFDRNAAHVQTWDCHRGPRQQWAVEPVGEAPSARDVEAGPIWNNADADQKCPAVCAPTQWTGAWRTTVPGRMSVCNCEVGGGPWPRHRDLEPHSGDEHGPGRGPRPMPDARFEDLLAAMNAETFPGDRMRVLEDASRDNYFVVAQLRRILDGLTFGSDKLRVVEVMAPRILDRQNAFTLYSAFSFESEKDQVRAIFDRQP